MGGFGSGRHHRWHKRTVVEDCLRLSLKRLFKQGTLVEGRYTSGSLTWRNGSKDVLGNILYEADMQDSEAATFTASFSYNKAPMVQRIVRMHYTVPHYGGRRWWFVCPVTGKCCSHLYIREGALGDAYEYLIGQFAAGSGKKAGEFYTPQQISTVLSAIVTLDNQDPKLGKKKHLDSVFDFACGSGSLLLNVRNQIKKAGGTVGKIFGQEKNITTYNLARMNMLLHGVKDTEFEIFHGDTLENDWDIDGEPNDIAKIIQTYQFRTEEDRYSKRVPIETIRDEHDYNLNISRYISTAKPEQEIDLATVHNVLEGLEKRINLARDKHNEFLRELGLRELP
jgi:hypothetical protein